MLAADDFVFCTGTTRGVDFLTKVRTASSAGFAGISIRPAEYDALVESGMNAASICSMLADHNLAIAELDPLMTWLPNTPPLPTMHDTDDVLRIANELRPHCISVLVPLDIELDLAPATDAFGMLCDRARVDGHRMAIEFFAWSPLHTLRDTMTIVNGAGRDNGGLIVDTWHPRRGGTADELRSIDGRLVHGVQIADAPSEPAHPDLATECRDFRRWPGDGALDNNAMVAALRDAGCVAPLGIEVFGNAADEGAAAVRAAHAYASLATVRDPARRPPR